MRFVPTLLPGVIVVEPLVHRDARGFFVETYHEPRYRENGIGARFFQDTTPAPGAARCAGCTGLRRSGRRQLHDAHLAS